MQVNFQTRECFVCGKRGKMTTHHVIPVQFNPLNNITVPVCEQCHTKINSVDFGAVASHLHKILKEMESQRKAVLGMQKIVDETTTFRMADVIKSKGGE
jgi:5-methylcytosine-specific restriction endonuclease McrA